MKSFEYTVRDTLGLHARPVGLLVKAAKQYRSRITLTANGREVTCNRLIALMELQVKQGCPVVIAAEGDDEELACEGMRRFLLDNNV